MSLVNDMLRDLDVRRREAPTRGLGSEKLVPATEGASIRSSRAKIVALVASVGVLTLAVIVFLMVTQDGSSGSLAPVQITPNEEATETMVAADRTATASTAPARTATTRTAPAPDSTAAVALAPGESQARPTATTAAIAVQDTAALSELEARLARLEQQNQALREQAQAQSSPSAPVETDWQPQDWSVDTAPATAQAATRTLSQDTQAAPVSLQPDVTSSTVAPLTAGGSSSRSPRAMSFEDSDRQQVQLALEQWSSGQRLSALQTLDSFTFENAEAHRSRETLAKLLIQQGENERALQVVDMGLAIAPRFHGYRKIKARLLLGQGSAEDALALLNNSAPSVSADPEYHDLLATANLSSQRFDSAVVSYQMLLQHDETVGRWWYGLGASMDAQGRTSEAANAYERALRSGELSANLRQNSQQRLQALRQAAGLN
ncbi:hypothetical protein [Pseudohongiella acticola]|jgi:MSHA biogenesis protein MshN|uniref:hypothetical protein n=1 Tax=Pseudohongiella acticola TaxID=1524254 RepID=UPI0030EEBEEB